MDIHPLLTKRWSPRAFQNKPVPDESLKRIFGAAQSSPSCFNAQPWRFMLGIKGKGTTYEKIWESLGPSNQVWAKLAPVLVGIFTKTTFAYNGKDNYWAPYDAGQSAAYLTFQIMEEGLYAHQMGGFDKTKLSAAFNSPPDMVPFAVMAIGYLGSPDLLPDDVKAKESIKSTRFDLNEIVFGEDWMNPFSF